MKYPVRGPIQHMMRVTVFLGFLSALSLLAYDSDEIQGPRPATQGSNETENVAALKQELLEQKKQIQESRQLLIDLKREIDSLKNQLAPTRNTDGPLTTMGRPERNIMTLGDVASTTPIIPRGLAPALPPVSAAQPALPQMAANQSSPLQLNIGDATITPVGFMDLTDTFRSTNSGASLKTNFGNFPYNNTPQGRLSENRISAQNSRLGLRVDANFKGSHVLGYYEGDFVGDNAGGNNQVTSNSVTYRMRLYWLNLRRGIWEFQAGQSWSLLTPNRNGLSALPGDLFYGQVVDVNYINGLTWGRIPGVRVIVHPSRVLSAGISLENSEQYIGGSGGGGLPTLPAALAASNFNNQVNNGTTNTSVPNVHPDIIAKIAFDTRLGGRGFHLEFAGIERTFKTFMPNTQRYFTKAGGGGSVNSNWEVRKNLRVITNNFWSDGGGRYLFGVAPDLVIRADGSPSLVHSGSTVSGIETQLGKTQLYAYYGGIYIQRNTARDVNRSLIGYGYSGSPNSQNRSTQEITGGLIHTLWRDGKYGAVQFMAQYAYFFRNPWYVGPNSPKAAQESAVWLDVRYVLPGTAPTIEY